MKKTHYFFIPVFLLIVIFAGLYLKFNQSSHLATSENAAQTNTVKNSDNPAPTANSPGKYLDYEPGIIENTTGKKVLFFHAPWCPQCRSIEADIKKQGVPDGLTIIKVDYDSSQNMRKKYGVKLQTTFVSIDDQGNKTGLYVAYNEPTFDSVKRNLLD